MRFGKGIRIPATSFVMALPLAQAADFGAPVIEVVDAAAPAPSPACSTPWPGSRWCWATSSTTWPPGASAPT